MVYKVIMNMIQSEDSYMRTNCCIGKTERKKLLDMSRIVQLCLAGMFYLFWKKYSVDASNTSLIHTDKKNCWSLINARNIRNMDN